MYARVTRYHADEDTNQLLEGFQETIGALQIVEGFSHGYFMVDPKTSEAMSMTVWETEEAMNESTGSAEERRRQRMESGHASVVSVDSYEIGMIAAAPSVEPAHKRVELVEEHGEETIVI